MNTISVLIRICTGCAVACLSMSLLLIVPSTASSQESLKISVMDFRGVALGSKAGKAAKARMEKLAEKLQKDMLAEKAKLLARRKDVEAALPKLIPAERQYRTAILEQDEATFQRLLEDKTEELKDIETKSIQELADQIDRILTTYAVEKGFSVVLEARRPGILYFATHLDISAEIIKRLNRTSK